MLTREDVLSALKLVPGKMIDSSPSELKRYFEKNYPENSIEENNLLTAYYLLEQVPFEIKSKDWKGTELYLLNKYSEISSQDDYRLKYCQVVHAAYINDMLVLGIV